jgi:hypothetical protein
MDAVNSLPNTGRVVSQQNAEAVPESEHHRTVSVQQDLSGITGTGAAAESARTMVQFGYAAGFGVFMMFLTSGVLGFAYHLQSRAIDQMQGQHDQRREDDKERERRNEMQHERMWKRVGEVVDASRQSSMEMRRATDAIEESSASLKKILAESKKIVGER